MLHTLLELYCLNLCEANQLPIKYGQHRQGWLRCRLLTRQWDYGHIAMSVGTQMHAVECA